MFTSVGEALMNGHTGQVVPKEKAKPSDMTLYYSRLHGRDCLAFCSHYAVVAVCYLLAPCYLLFTSVEKTHVVSSPSRDPGSSLHV
jgi:hypothetical protein